MLQMGNVVKINDNGLIGEVCDIYDGLCYVDVDPEDLNGTTPDLTDRLFYRLP